MNKVAIFCGSSYGNEKIFKEYVSKLGHTLASRGIGVVYGGAKVGLMGIIADSVLNAGGEVIGVIPKFLQGKEIAHDKLTDLIIVDTMHQRKSKMDELSDGVIALPGGFGTMEEFFEILTWGQLGLHKKPMGLLNIDGFFDPLLQFIQNMVDKGFLKRINQEMVLVSSDVDQLLDRMENYQPPTAGKWIEK